MNNSPEEQADIEAIKIVLELARRHVNNNFVAGDINQAYETQTKAIERVENLFIDYGWLSQKERFNGSVHESDLSSHT